MNDKDEAQWVEAGTTLRELRTKEGGSVHKVAKAIHISGNYLSLIERGLKAPSDPILDSLAKYYNINRSELYALYERVAPQEKELLFSNPQFHKVITRISIDDRLTTDEKNYLAETLGDLYKGLIKKKSGQNREEV